MAQIIATIDIVKATAERVGLAELAREAGVPYTTVKSFADRQWSHKNLTVLQKLSDAAGRLNEASPKPAKPSASRAA